MIGLDIETAPRGDAPPEYALQPWRVTEGTAQITAVSLVKSSGEARLEATDAGFRKILTVAEKSGQAICTWNGIFDVAFLVAAGYDVSKIRWLDAMLLWKWYSNSQRMEWIPAWSLADGAGRWLSDWPQLGQFLALKSTDNVVGDDDQYWELRCKMDSLVTVMIAEIIWAKLTPKQQRSAMITMQCIVPVAQSWFKGVKLQFDTMDRMAPAVTRELQAIEQSLGVQNPPEAKIAKTTILYGDWFPSSILRSPKQVGELLYDTWGIECDMFTDKGARATSKAALTYIADHDDRAIEILRWRELSTQLTKFIESPGKAREYLMSDIMHPAPKLFSTYTGRMTYSSKTKNKFHTGIALHQWPRNKKLRELIRV